MAPARQRRPAALSDRAYEAILRQIVSGELAPGEQLPSEDRLASRFGVTRTTLRRALKRLRDDRLVIAVKGAGNFAVRAPLADSPEWMASGDAREVAQRFEVRRALEVEAAGLAAMRRGEAHITQLGDVLDRMTALLESTRADRTVQLRMSDIAFHETLHAAADNPSLRALCGPFLVHPANWLAQWGGDRTRHAPLAAAVLAEHRSILVAVHSADAEAARAAMRLHVTNALARNHVT